MGVMGIAVKVLIGLVLLLPMTAYVVHGLVAAAVEPTPHTPIIVQEQTNTPKKQDPSPSGKPTEKPGHHKKGHGEGQGRGNDDNNPPTVIPPSPSDLFDDNGGDEDNSGKGSGGGEDDSSGKGSGHG